MHAQRLTRLTAIVLVLATGVFTGAQLAKTAPLIGWYVNEVGLSLVEAGWLTALIGIFVALAALPVGIAIGRTGAHRAFVCAAVLIIVGGLALASSRSAVIVYPARLVEGAGYVVLCIALPSILAGIALPNWRGPVLAVWSGFVPLGYAASDFIALALLPVIGEQGFLAVMTILFAALAGVSHVVLCRLPAIARSSASSGARAVATAPILLTAVAFGAFVVQSVALFTFLPTLALERPDLLLVAAGVIPLSVPIGNALAGMLVAGRSGAYMMRLASAAFMVTAMGAASAFLLPSPAATTFGCLVVAIASGVVASALFAAIPVYVGERLVPSAIGLVSQAGGLATLVSPPLAALIIEQAGWAAYGWLLAVLGIIGAGVVLPLTLAARRQAP